MKCKCGASFTPRLLAEHIALHNPHWPRTNLLDEHDVVRQLVPPKPSTWKPSGKPLDPTHPTRDRNMCDKRSQRLALRAANRLLAKSGYFVEPEMAEDEAVDADACGVKGLRPTWHGKA